MPSKNSDNSHLDVYLDRYELHQNDVVTTYYEGFQNAATQQRYEKINTALSNGYLYDVMKKLPDVDFGMEISGKLFVCGCKKNG